MSEHMRGRTKFGNSQLTSYRILHGNGPKSVKYRGRVAKFSWTDHFIPINPVLPDSLTTWFALLQQTMSTKMLNLAMIYDFRKIVNWQPTIANFHLAKNDMLKFNTKQSQLAAPCLFLRRPLNWTTKKSIAFNAKNFRLKLAWQLHRPLGHLQRRSN